LFFGLRGKKEPEMKATRFIFLSEMDRNSRLFQECLRLLSSVDPKNWSRERIVYCFDVLHYDGLVYTDGKRLIGIAAFNPDIKEGIVKSFFLYVVPERRKRGIGKALWVELIKWAHGQGFKGGQFGLGNNVAATAVLESIKRDQERLGLQFTEIDPTTGKIFFIHSPALDTLSHFDKIKID